MMMILSKAGMTKRQSKKYLADRMIITIDSEMLINAGQSIAAKTFITDLFLL
jgi:hypothetical protein